MYKVKFPTIPKLKVEKEMTDVFFYKNKNYTKEINIPDYIKGEDNVDEDNLQIFYNDNNVCKKGSINENYGLKAFLKEYENKICIGLLVIKFKEDNYLPKDLPYVYKKYAKDTLGLMVITEDKTKENQLNIEFLCTKKNDIFTNIGTVFLDYVYDFALFFKNKKDVIFLESLPEAKGFYEKLGFEELKETDGLYEMKKKVEKKDIYNRIKSSISRISSKISKKTTPQSKQPPLSPVVSESESENTQKFINLSKKEDLSKKEYGSLGGNTTRKHKKQKKNKRHKKHTYKKLSL